MRLALLVLSTFLSWPAYDLNLFRRRRDSLTATATEISENEGQEFRQRKQIKRHHLDVIPRRYREQKKPVPLRCNYFSTKPRDVRFSDQRKIRRMFNSM
jgi:hypothetical protein